MYLQQLKNIMSLKNLNQADIARLGGLSRAAVSKWFHSKHRMVNVESKTLLNLAKALKVSPDFFLQERADLAKFESRFLWDYLYPDMGNFLKALAQNRLPAFARLLQVLGFREARAVAGKKIVARFEKYKKYIKPARRKELEVLWPLYNS